MNAMPDRPVARSSNRIEELDGLRALCVLAVILAHETGAGRVPMTDTLSRVVENWGPLGVQCFFGISGFIITRLLLEEQRREGRIGLGAFYLRRFFRIIPAYWTYLFVVLVMTLAGWISVTPSGFIAALAFVTDYQFYTNAQAWFIGHSWSLSVEEQYYIVFPVVLWGVLGGRRRAMFVFLGALYLLGAYLDKFTAALHLTLPVDDFTSFKYIIAGVLLALVWERVGFLFRRVTFLVPLAILVLLALRALYTPVPLWGKLATPLEAIGVIYLLGWCVQNPGPCAPLRWGAVQWLGRCSYSIYLWQQVFTGLDAYYLRANLATLPWSLAGIFLCAAVSYHFIERPSMRLGHRLSKRLNPATLSQRAEAAAIAST
jgi:peptidoglycan/LPS O-acetylase OafA/YrhL